MPSLIKLLEHTLLFTAARGANAETGSPPADPEARKTEFAPPPVPKTDISDLEARHLPIWHWKTSAPHRFESVTCLSRGMGNARMGVCESITFGNVMLTLPGAKSAITLSLEEKFLVESYGLERGRVLRFRKPPKGRDVPAGMSELFPLRMNVDKSSLRVFVYEFPKGSQNPPRPIAKKLTGHENFMPAPTAPSSLGTVSRAQIITTTATHLRVVVFVSLVCCKERADFDPGGVLGGARLIPHVMVMANLPVQKIETRIGIRRPAALSMQGGNHEHCLDMNHAIEASLFADDNDPKQAVNVNLGPLKIEIPSPFWNDLFDAYLAPARPSTYNVVNPKFGKRTLDQAVQKIVQTPHGKAKHGFNDNEYVAHGIRRVQRQGAFDNIHVAPTMKIAKVSRSGVPPSSFAKVYMAPFCEHDCLHTHWRWSTSVREIQNLGWSAPDASKVDLYPGKPYSVRGAPMVPVNQRIDIQITAPNSFDYVATVEGKFPIHAGTFTVINHHGSAYAVAVMGAHDKLPNALALAKIHVRTEIEENSLAKLGLSSAQFYWHLRHTLREKASKGAATPPTFIAKERISIVSLDEVLHA